MRADSQGKESREWETAAQPDAQTQPNGFGTVSLEQHANAIIKTREEPRKEQKTQKRAVI